MSLPQRFLITGLSGFVGQRLSKALHARFVGCEVFGLGSDGLNGRIESPEDTGNAAKRLPDVVFHLAARSSVAHSTKAGFETMQVNLGGTQCLAAALHEYAPRAAVIFASSGETYGNSFLGGAAATEDTPLQPNSPYARSKAAGEWAMRDMLSDETAVISLRLFNHSGAGQDARFVIPSFATQIATIEAKQVPPVIKVGNLGAERDFLHVDDVIDAYLAIAEHAMDLKPSFQTYNVCSGVPTKIEDLLSKLIAMSSMDIAIEIDPDRLRPSEITTAFGDNTAFRTAYNWLPRRSLDTMLADVLTGALKSNYCTLTTIQ